MPHYYPRYCPRPEIFIFTYGTERQPQTDKFAGEDNRDITLIHYDGTMEYEEDGHKYWVAYNGNPDNVKLDDGETFVIVVIY
jgi:hypothetical protein